MHPQTLTASAWPALWLVLFMVAAGCATASPNDAVLVDKATSDVADDSAVPAPASSASVEVDSPESAADQNPPTSASEVPDVARATRATPPTADGAEFVEPDPAAPEPAEDGPRAVPLAPAPIGVDALTPVATGPQPISIGIDDLDIVDATVIPVGVNPDETFEVPPADEVGWYRFGPTPGDDGSAVLAAHIAYNGVDGVFRHLADVAVGTEFEIGFDDGSTTRYRIESVDDYYKEELPDSLFARDGKPQIALITCGGAFNPQLRSYESNTVAVAVPL